jgi:tyrosine-protein kinase Etk/Wzc
VENQLRLSTAEFQASLRELQEYKEGQQITDLGAQETAIVQTIRQLEQDKHSASVQVSTIGDAMASSDSIGVETLNRLAATDGIGANAALNFQITGLLERYDERNGLTAGALGLNENNPQVTAVDQQIRHGHRALRGAVTATITSIESRIEAIDREIQRQRSILSAFPSMESRIGQLNLESNILHETQRYLLGQYQAARMQEATIAPYIQVIDDASPAFNVGTSLRQRVLLGVLVGLLLGLAAAFFLEYLDQTIKTPSDIERVLGVPVLGIIPLDPKLAPRSNGAMQPGATIAELDPDEPAVEAYRALRTNVTFVGAEKPLQFVAVTSPGPREGKTTTAINLALTLAQSGRKTILVDGDLRRSAVHRAFGLVQEPGLTDVLVGNVSAAEAVRPEVAPSLDLLPSGSTPPNPSELLGSSAMDALVMELRHDYEFIIMDTPPTLPVTDAAVVSITADATMLVVRSGDTEETAAQRALDQLRRVRARIAGAILNAITHRKDPQYSYYSYRRDPPQVRSRVRAVASRVAGLK